MSSHFEVDTSVTSGIVTTQYYGEKFQPDLVERELDIRISINPPQSVRESNIENIILHFKVEKVSMTELAGDSEDTIGLIDSVDDYVEYLDTEQTIVYKNFTILNSTDFKVIYLSRSVSSTNVEQQKLDVMPGFRLQWWYTGAAELKPDSSYQDAKLTKHFVR